MTEEVAQGAKKNVLIRKKSRPNPIRVKMDPWVMNLIKNMKMQNKVLQRRERSKSSSSCQGLKARSDHLQRMSADPGAETGIEMRKQRPEIKKDEKKTEGEKEAEVETDDATVTGRTGEEEHPGTKIVGQEVQTGVRPETRTEAGAPEAEVTGETAAKTDLIEKTDAEMLPTNGDDAAAAAAAQRATEPIKGGDKGAQIPQGEPGVPPNPKTEEARPDRTVLKVKINTVAKGIGRAPALAVTDCGFYWYQSVKLFSPQFFAKPR